MVAGYLDYPSILVVRSLEGLAWQFEFGCVIVKYSAPIIITSQHGCLNYFTAWLPQLSLCLASPNPFGDLARPPLKAFVAELVSAHPRFPHKSGKPGHHDKSFPPDNPPETHIPPESE